jgi:hypothetical protein
MKNKGGKGSYARMGATFITAISKGLQYFHVAAGPFHQVSGFPISAAVRASAETLSQASLEAVRLWILPCVDYFAGSGMPASKLASKAFLVVVRYSALKQRAVSEYVKVL